jgi:putative phosphoribosyl transferase
MRRIEEQREAVMRAMETAATAWQAVRIEGAGVTLQGDLFVPPAATGVVLFAHGSGSSRHSPRNREVAESLHQSGLGTLLFDLLTTAEEAEDRWTRQFRFDIPLLARRLIASTDWIVAHGQTNLPLGYFGASTGAAAALIAAAERADLIGAVVSRGGRPDLAGRALERVRAPTLLLVGGADREVIGLNELALDRLRCDKRLVLVPGATHLFEEPGALESVATLAGEWFVRCLALPSPR